ncbi:lytic transglycosylase domain-containing protein [Rhodanobacter glycinis]|uniref:Lytic transglycosylase domain-containing protein n=1 Tax=Rhodanobacter glycinis TaxID=582702 RepID=A0A502CJB2_9GAMM|nr:lytic transglycosylase domain-containing protein [Rhodanobacter glycinis]TPG11791.1 lytic transglycosylase domain-containing protein [Rhodanobacter glycinis]TPG47355.1 lytic transglycosylase domain-containing protein [Rhodanobacter glycinis]
MLPGMEMLACPNLAVSPEVMQHIVHVESSANPYAIGVVGGQLERQPRNLPEALATAQMLDTKGYNFSLGLAQVNRANLGRYGLDSYQKAFSACANLSAGAHILADCYASAHGDWGKAFSCYYSGNFTTGFRDGYVQKVYASINRDANAPGKVMSASVPAAEAIALRSKPEAPTSVAEAPTRTTDLKPVTVYAPGGANYRVALRSMAIDAAAAATVPAIIAAISRATPANAAAAPSPGSPAIGPTDANTNQAVPAAPGRVDASLALTLTAINQTPTAPSGNPSNDAVFVPQVHGPNDLPEASASTESAPSITQATSSNAGADRADLHQEQRDAAFVF